MQLYQCEAYGRKPLLVAGLLSIATGCKCLVGGASFGVQGGSWRDLEFWQNAQKLRNPQMPRRHSWSGFRQLLRTAHGVEAGFEGWVQDGSFGNDAYCEAV